MKKLILILFLLLPTNAVASSQVIFGGTDDSVTAGTSKRWLWPMGGGGSDEGNYNNRVRYLMPTAGSMSELHMEQGTAPGAGSSITWSLRHPTSQTLPGLYVTIEGTDTTGDSGGDSIHFVAGDVITIRFTGVNSPAATKVKWSFKFTPDIDGETLLGVNGRDGVIGTSTHYLPMGGQRGNTFPIVRHTGDFYSQAAATVTKLRAGISTAPGAGETRVFEVIKNGSVTGMKITFNEGDTSANTTGSIAFAIADTIGVKATVTGAPSATTVRCSMVVVHDDTKEFFLITNGGGNLAVRGTRYTELANGETAWGNTESAKEILGQHGISRVRILSGRVKLSGAPGSFPTKSYKFTVRKNGADTGLTGTVGAMGTTTAISGASVEVNDGDIFSMKCVPTNTPAARVAIITLLCEVSDTPTVWIRGGDILGAAIK